MNSVVILTRMRYLLFAGILLLSLPAACNLVCGDAWYAYLVEGQVVDANSGEPLSGIRLTARILDSPDEVPEQPSDQHQHFLSQEDGSFRIEFSSIAQSGDCGPAGTLDIVRPDLPDVYWLYIFVVMDDCTRTQLINVIEDATVAIEEVYDVIKVRDPILVQPCDDP